MSHCRSAAFPILCGLAWVACLGSSQAQTCPCWTLEELAGIRPQTLCWCTNNLDPDLDPTAVPATCTSINNWWENPEGPCRSGVPDEGWALAWTGAIGPSNSLLGPGCFFDDNVQNISNRLFTEITIEEALACADDIAALGETVDNFMSCSIDSSTCQTDGDCDTTCSIDDSSCLTDDDCPPTGTCFDPPNAFCRTDDDCPGIVDFCANIQAQTCDAFQTCDAILCLDECFPPDCRILPDEDSTRFTRQKFDATYGLLSELGADGDFSRATCDPVLHTNSWDHPPDPILDDGIYFLFRATEGVSCRDHGNSTLSPDVRDLLDATCP